MAWDSSRHVPWRRFATEFVLFCAITTVVFYFVLQERRASTYLAVPIGAGLYVAFGAILAKFGYQRKTLRQLREETRQREAMKAAQRSGAGAARTVRPAATSRTNARNRQARRR